MAAVAALYILANAAYLRLMTIPEIAASERVGADLATRTMGPIGGRFVSITVLLSIIGAVNGCILTAARIPFGGHQVDAAVTGEIGRGNWHPNAALWIRNGRMEGPVPLAQRDPARRGQV
jgi:amino acid transporter